MKITPEEIHFEFNRNTYWTRIAAESDSGRKSTILVCAPRNCISDHYRIPTMANQDDAQRFFDEVVLADIRQEFEGGELDREVYYKVYSMTPEGQQNGMEFLQNEVTP